MSKARRKKSVNTQTIDELIASEVSEPDSPLVYRLEIQAITRPLSERELGQLTDLIQKALKVDNGVHSRDIKVEAIPNET